MPNRLKLEKSPYLLQHYENPVDWYPWGKEAFQKAKEDDKPVLLSIGYSTCHWCHVMAHESFEDREVAEILNRNFVSIKVDREERPDIDAVYMSVCQTMTGSGGWPLTILMTPEQKPFYAGTYFPKTSRYGMPGITELLTEVAQRWKENRQELLVNSEKILRFLNQEEQATKTDKPTESLLQESVAYFKSTFDKTWGGFGGAPKFPTPHNLLFLLRYCAFTQDETVQNMAEHTLLQMYKGGIFDHIGGGFSRYSTDRKWLVPHFEKMLYDNALLSLAYLEAFSLTDVPLYKTVVQRTLDYVLRELTDPQGGFYCGQDADSDGIEGKYYVFTKAELEALLGKREADLFCDWFGVTEKGNFEGQNILNLLDNPNYKETPHTVKRICRKLYAYRFERTALHKDDKVLTSWSSLMIAALAKAGRTFKEARYLQAAQKAQHFIERSLTNEDGSLLVRWRDGESAHAGGIDDYAFYAFALLELYKTTLSAEYLEKAVCVAKKMLLLFFDEENGGFYLYDIENEQLITRPKETYDGAMPSGNSVAALVLLRLYKLTGENLWQTAGDKQTSFLAPFMQKYPGGCSFSMLALQEAFSSGGELVCVTNGETVPEELESFLYENKNIPLTLLLKTAKNEVLLSKLAPFTNAYPIPENGTLYYFCQNKACNAAVNNINTLKKLINK